MKLQVLHDKKGAIKLLSIIHEGDQGEIGIHAGTGEYVSIVDAPSVRHPQDSKNLRELYEHHRVDSKDGKARLVRI